MKKFPFSLSLAAVLTLSTPAIAFAHVGHGDEFQATGGIQKVKVNAATDKQLGIEVKEITSATVSGKAVLIPFTSLVEADGKQLIFVQYQNFYEPVPVKTGASKGDLIEITEGLSVGEKLVTQGSLTLYAESRKTKPTTATAATKTAPTAISNPVSPSATSNTEGGFSIMQASIAGGGALLVATGAIAFAATRGKGKKGDS